MRNRDIVTATDIAEWSYCPEALRLREQGHAPANQPHLDAGTSFHAGLTVRERVAGASIAIGRILIALAILGMLAWFFFSR